MFSESLLSDPEIHHLAQSLRGKIRKPETPGEGNVMEEEEGEDENRSDTDSEAGDFEGLESHGVFDKLNIQDNGVSSDVDVTWPMNSWFLYWISFHFIHSVGG